MVIHDRALENWRNEIGMYRPRVFAVWWVDRLIPLGVFDDEIGGPIPILFFVPTEFEFSPFSFLFNQTWKVEGKRFWSLPMLFKSYTFEISKNFSRVFHFESFHCYIHIYKYIVKRCHDTPLGGEDLASKSSLRCIKACHPIIYTWIYAETSRPLFIAVHGHE